jgi:Tol biopolymer transport system component
MIYVIGADGGNEARVAKGLSPAWSPDGRRFAFTSEEGISVMNVDGSGVKTLIRHDFRNDTYEPWDMGIGKPTWSPDGNHIAFEHLGDGDIQPAQVFVMNADGTDPGRLSARYTNIRYAESDPAWSSDGSRLAFWSYGFGVAVANVADGLVTTVYSNFPYVAYGAKPSWSPDGKFVTFNTFASSLTRATDVLIVPVSGGGTQRTLIMDAYGARWSPDGSRIVFVSNRSVRSK